MDANIFLCYVCKACHKSSALLCQHLRLHHGLYPGKTLRLKCGQPGCSSLFCTYSGFKKHLVHFHRDVAVTNTADNVDTQNEVDEPSTSQTVNKASPTTTQLSVDNDHVLNMCAFVVAQLQASGVAESTVQAMVGSMEDLVNYINRQAREAVLSCSSEIQGTDLEKKVEKCFDQLGNPFSSLNTRVKRQKFFEDKWEIVEPVEYVLGVRFDVRRDQTTGVSCQVPVTDKFVYTPILGTLKSMFKNTELCESFFQAKHHEEGIYKDICDGSYFKSNILFSQKKHALQIQLYFDEFETANPLGSKKGIHKLGCIYFILRNLPPKYNSVLMNIHVVALFHSQDLKTYGFDEILKPLVDDLKILETQGIEVPFSDSPLLGSVIQVTGDNLGLHGLFSFVESFSATYFCRFCLTSKDESQSVFTEDDPGIIFRTKEIHAEHCAALHENPMLSSTFGVKKTCLLNTLHFFHTSDNYAVDIMHDLLEGVVQYELKLVFQYLVNQKYLSLESLSQRIQTFNYGYIERKNRPSGLKMDEASKDLGLNAIQSWCLVRNTPLIFGDVLERNNCYWNLLLLLIQIVNIVFSPIVTNGMTNYLKHLIKDHHKLFKCLFSQKRLFPKHHFMLHYPRCIRKIGPLLHVWCMRFEAKHNFFKRSVKNFKNITKSLVKQHQSQLPYHWENFNFQRFEFGPVKNETIDHLEGGEVLSSVFDVNLYCEVSTTNWVKNYGTEYQIGMFICTGTKMEIPIFRKITNIIVHDGQAFLLTCRVDTLYFDDHFNAYCVDERADSFSVFPVKELIYHRPYDKQFSNEMCEKIYIVPHCHIL
ncbi:uncharacterized protein LOC111571121 isoform X1 [Amphiprion ocellaris]|uniref:uncharacterized protein LOC111571121 isoform X1 n=1 Tax=Amphiprion ocellaris TaxID=80972 RepID=UPI001649D9CE|nr:uncharacterized protein LOC111571121 isoform X1 [Amphiprion ocellaris]XP_054871232.1 uncharacterized protein LOC118470399 isoform X1 [Amphiprion ocellaris]XP_054871233.1 uncharacterized protein LOC118470399 isoform X1 [Amphiprion ocellaris]XP_054871234.1 uncharacterized protein LOC118470399 isoform X1 [Amphiprion ocellaris]XP_054871235.1 uncharacterized protein LOC118470399 isoform X1 [Amphiprion ocellaris]XP_054871236.1 uncharacterized protein LOC118470399 isoform X1 [Amphiprion ocellaris]